MKDTTPTKVELLQHIQELQDMLAKAQRGVEPVAWRVNGDLVLHEHWAIELAWPGSFVSTGRAIPNSWVPALYAAPQRTAAAGTPESGIDSIPNSMSCQPTASTPRTTGLDEVLEYYDPIAARAPVDDCEYDFVMTAAEYRVIRDEIDNAAQLRAELSKHQESEFHPDWSMLQATRESLREHQEIIVELRAALDFKNRQSLQMADALEAEKKARENAEYAVKHHGATGSYKLLCDLKAAEARVRELEGKHD